MFDFESCQSFASTTLEIPLRQTQGSRNSFQLYLLFSSYSQSDHLEAMSTSTDTQDPVAYVSGNVFTADDDGSRVEAFIVSESGIFTAVGTNDEIIEIAQRQSIPTVDLKHQFAMPGIHDAHVHILMGSLSTSSYLQPGMDATMSNIAARLKSPECACEHAHVFGDWVVGSLYRIEDFDREALDVEYPDTPVLLRGGAAHAMFMNTAALQKSGYSLDEPDAPHEQFFRRPDGSLTGEVTELAMTKAALAMPQPTMDHV